MKALIRIVSASLAGIMLALAWVETWHEHGLNYPPQCVLCRAAHAPSVPAAPSVVIEPELCIEAAFSSDDSLHRGPALEIIQGRAPPFTAS